MKLVVAYVFLLMGLVAGQAQVSPDPDCPNKLIAMDEAVEKALLLTNPNLKPFTDAEDFRQSYCE